MFVTPLPLKSIDDFASMVAQERASLTLLVARAGGGKTATLNAISGAIVDGSIDLYPLDMDTLMGGLWPAWHRIHDKNRDLAYSIMMDRIGGGLRSLRAMGVGGVVMTAIPEVARRFPGALLVNVDRGDDFIQRVYDVRNKREVHKFRMNKSWAKGLKFDRTFVLPERGMSDDGRGEKDDIKPAQQAYVDRLR